jgi:hypothetical protein
MVPKIAMFARFDLTVHTRVVRLFATRSVSNSAEPSLLVDSHMNKGVKQSNKRLLHRASSRTLKVHAQGARAKLRRVLSHGDSHGLMTRFASDRGLGG